MPLHDIAPASPLDGWLSDGATWTPASTTTFTVSGDQTDMFSKGTRLKLTQSGTQKYLVVAASSHSSGTTTVTATGGSDYSLHASDPISGNFFSYAANPWGYPSVFAYTPTWGSSGTQPALGNGTILGRFSVVGRDVAADVDLTMGSTTTYGTGEYTLSLPTTVVGNPILPDVLAFDSSASNFRAGWARLSSATAVALMNLASPGAGYSPTVPFTWASGDVLRFAIAYRL